MRQVVGAVIIRDGRVLAARRTSPGSHAGRWEFPGGKVEPDETMATALAREIDEELGCAIEIVGWLPLSVPVRPDVVLTLAQARLVDGEPVAGPDHDALRWLAADALDDVAWLDADVAFLDEVRSLLLSS